MTRESHAAGRFEFKVAVCPLIGGRPIMPISDEHNAIVCRQEDVNEGGEWLQIEIQADMTGQKMSLWFWRQASSGSAHIVAEHLQESLYIAVNDRLVKYAIPTGAIEFNKALPFLASGMSIMYDIGSLLVFYEIGVIAYDLDGKDLWDVAVNDIIVDVTWPATGEFTLRTMEGMVVRIDALTGTAL